MSQRVFAFIVDDEQAIDIAIKQFQQLNDFSVKYDSIVAFTYKQLDNFLQQSVVIPQENLSSDTLIRNYINSYFKKLNFKGFLHVISKNVIFKSKISEYVCQLEKAMDILDYSVHFSTVTDQCNYVYSVYNPRLQIHIDDEKYARLQLPESLMFTSHSNVAYVTYDFSKIPDDLLKFNDQFSIAMFYIIEFLARRRNTKAANQLYYMNMYMAVPLEKEAIQNNPKIKNNDVSQDVFKKEDELFKSLKIDFSPDNNIDKTLEQLYKTLEAKCI